MRGELHIHSTYSDDGKQSVSEILERCRSLGIQAVAITDHNAVQGSLDALKEKGNGLIVLTGTEISTADGHLLAYNIFEPLPRDRSIEETIDLIHAAGGLAVAPHPYRTWSGLGQGKIIGRRLDGIETMNSRSLAINNHRAARLARSMKVAETGGSDSHSPRTVGRAYTVFPDDCTTAEDLVKAIRARRTSSGGTSKSVAASVVHGLKSVGRWSRRGFKRL